MACEENLCISNKILYACALPVTPCAIPYASAEKPGFRIFQGDLSLAGPVMDNIKRAGYDKPTPVQKHALPIGEKQLCQVLRPLACRLSTLLVQS